MPANVATREQFNALDSRFSYHPEFAQNVFINNANAVDYLHGDGKLDMVMSFAQKDLAKNMMAGAVYDTYLYTQEGRERVTAFDNVRIKGQTNKKYSSKERGHDH